MLKAIKSAINAAVKNAEEAKQERLRQEQQQQLLNREYIAALKAGRLPTIQSSLLLNTGEYCYLEIPTVYTRATKSGLQETQGLLTLTSTRILFNTSTGSGSWKMSLDNIMAVNGSGSKFSLTTGGTRGSGSFSSGNQHAGLIVESAAKLFKRLMVMTVDESQSTRRLSQEVKVTVWQRDGGKCVQCSATEYLEFDHVIPFSKGGANTEANIQILCRNCNLQKSNRI